MFSSKGKTNFYKPFIIHLYFEIRFFQFNSIDARYTKRKRTASCSPFLIYAECKLFNLIMIFQ